MRSRPPRSGKTWEYPVDWGIDFQTDTSDSCWRSLQKAGYPHRLPEGHQGFLHARQRRRQNRTRHGRLRSRSARLSAAPSARTVTIYFCTRFVTSAVMRSLLVVFRFALGAARPHSGFGLGLERVVMYLTGMGNSATSFPSRARPEIRRLSRPANERFRHCDSLEDADDCLPPVLPH